MSNRNAITCRPYLWIVVLLFLAGCQQYEVFNEAIPMELGVRAPVTSPIIWGDGTVTDFEYSGLTHDYRFRDDDGSTGTARVMRLKDNDYVVQSRYDGESSYMLHFFRVDPYRDTFTSLFLGIDPTPTAARYGIRVETGTVSDYILHGGSENLLAFIREHARLPFVTE